MKLTTAALSLTLLAICATQLHAFDLLRTGNCGFTVTGDAAIDDASGSAGPVHIQHWDAANVNIDMWEELYLETEDSVAYGSASAYAGWFEHEPGSIMADCHISTQAYADSYDPEAQLTLDTSAETSTAPGTHGYFFQIIPTEPGEMIGDEVIVDFNIGLYAQVSRGRVTFAGSNGMDHMAITLNQPTPVWPDAPDPAYEVWTRDNITYTTDATENHSGQFTAHIGDTVGVFIKATSQVEYNGLNDSWVNGNPSVYFTFTLVTNPMDFNNDGYVNLIDFSIFANEYLWTRPGR